MESRIPPTPGEFPLAPLAHLPQPGGGGCSFQLLLLHSLAFSMPVGLTG